MFQKIKPFLISLVVLIPLVAIGAEVLQVKGSKVLLNIGGTDASPGSEFFALDGNGKKRAILRVKQVKGEKAIGELVKGKVEPGMSLKQKGSASASSDSGSSNSRVQDVNEPEERSKRPRGFMGSFLKRGTGIGFMGGIAQNTMSLTAKNAGISQDVSLTGNSFNALAYYDYDFSPVFTFRGNGGIETFNASGTTSNSVLCGGTTCSVAFTYLAFEGHAHYNFMTGSTRAWVGAGFDFLLTASKSSSIANLDTSSATNQMMDVEVGADFGLGGGAVVPVAFEYAIFPGSTTVKASSMLLKAGYGWRY